MIRRRSLATLADGGVRRNSDRRLTSASEDAGKEAFLRLLGESQRHGLAQKPRNRIFVGVRYLALVIEDHGGSGVGGRQHVSGLRNDADHFESENLIHVGDA